MQKVTLAAKVIRFGAYDVDLAGQELRKGGIKIKLQPRPLQILTVLLENAGTSVSREELKKLIWAPETFVDFDHGLNSAINKIREALNDSADNPRFVETLPSGYRFLGVIEQTTPAVTAQPGHGPLAAEPAASHWRIRLGVIAAATVCLLVASLFAGRYGHAFFSQPKLEAKSIAVLPLRNLSGDAAQEYFSDSMTDELITQLAKTSTLRVVSAGSVKRFKNSDIAIPEIGRALKVDALVEGSVLRSGDKVRITAQLIDAVTDRHIWAEDYHGDMRDILVLQNNIAAAIAGRVQAGIAPAKGTKLGQPHRVNPRAYDAYIKGRGYWFRSKTFGAEEGDLEQSAIEFRRAIEYDPNFGSAYAGLANYYGLLAGFDKIPPKDGWKMTEELAQKALALDECSAEAHHALATKFMFYDWDWSGAEREIRLGLGCDSHYAELYNTNAHYLSYMGRFDEAIASAHKAEELDPVNQRSSVQRALRSSRRYEEFLAEVERVFSSDRPQIHENRAFVHRARKEYAGEVAETDLALRAQGCIPDAERLAKASARGGYRGWQEAKLSDLKKLSSVEYVPPLDFAVLYAEMGNTGMAIQYLEAAYRERSAWLVRLQVLPDYDGLHSDPRYQDLVRRVGLPAS